MSTAETEFRDTVRCMYEYLTQCQILEYLYRCPERLASFVLLVLSSLLAHWVSLLLAR